MKISDSQRLPLQTCLTQVQGEVSADVPPERLSSFPSDAAAGVSLLFANLTLRNDSPLCRKMAIMQAASRFKTHSASSIEAV